jgi:hypothetical protein
MATGEHVASVYVLSGCPGDTCPAVGCRQSLPSAARGAGEEFWLVSHAGLCRRLPSFVRNTAVLSISSAWHGQTSQFNCQCYYMYEVACTMYVFCKVLTEE